MLLNRDIAIIRNNLTQNFADERDKNLIGERKPKQKTIEERLDALEKNSNGLQTEIDEIKSHLGID